MKDSFAMIYRRQVYKLVVATLQTEKAGVSAYDLFSGLKQAAPSVLREEKVRGFKSFVKILNAFPEIQAVHAVGKDVKVYELGKHEGLNNKRGLQVI